MPGCQEEVHAHCLAWDCQPTTSITNTTVLSDNYFLDERGSCRIVEYRDALVLMERIVMTV
jgi:hypothetical protein